jgi:hypothetical protein
MTNRRRRRIALLVSLLIVATVAVSTGWLPLDGGGPPVIGDGTFMVQPYLQPGDAPKPGADGREHLALLWQTPDPGEGADAPWSVEVQADPGNEWVAAGAPTSRRLAVEGVPPIRLYRADLTGLKPGAGFTYRVRRGNQAVFEARGSTRKPAGTPHRFVAFGDCALKNSPGQKAVAYQTYLARPDYVMITGDIVYSRGRASEYLDHFFPVYNADKADPKVGAPLLRSTVFLAAPGNHDLVERNLDRLPDTLGFFYEWALPLNGPSPAAGSGLKALGGSEARRQAFLEAAGPAFPKMANYSYDYGDVHWTVLDANPHAEWSEGALRDWVEADLAAARGSAWRLVALHHPPFHSSKSHADDQRMRLLAPVFEKHGVAVVLAGHVHNYQRSRPLKFTAGPPPADAKTGRYGPAGQVDGKWVLDGTYDGKTHTRPDGVIYLVTGAGGARLYNPEQTDMPDSWRDYTARFVSNVHSLTVVDVTPEALTCRQVAADGTEVDRFVVTRGEPAPAR